MCIISQISITIYIEYIATGMVYLHGFRPLITLVSIKFHKLRGFVPFRVLHVEISKIIQKDENYIILKR